MQYLIFTVLLKIFGRHYEYYSGVEDIENKSISFIAQLAKTFVSELILNPLKQIPLSQKKFAGAKPRTIMPLQFGLTITADNQLVSKWLNILLSRLEFSVS